MSDIVKADASGLGLLEDLEKVDEAGGYHLKGYSYSNIAEIMDVSVYKAKQYVTEYYRILNKQAEDDPYFLERIQENTLRFLKELDEIGKEAWETVNIATDNAMITARTQALKLALDVTTKKAQMLQVLGAKTSTDADYVARLQKAERVNGMLSELLREVVSECPRCNELARTRLAEAFTQIEYEEAEVVDVE